MSVGALVVGGASGISYAMTCRIAAKACTSVITISGGSNTQGPQLRNGIALWVILKVGV